MLCSVFFAPETLKRIRIAALKREECRILQFRRFEKRKYLSAKI